MGSLKVVAESHACRTVGPGNQGVGLADRHAYRGRHALAVALDVYCTLGDLDLPDVIGPGDSTGRHCKYNNRDKVAHRPSR
jgi:hypothetical protein